MPAEHPSGAKRRQGSIIKAGNSCPPRLLVGEDWQHGKNMAYASGAVSLVVKLDFWRICSA